MEESWVGVFRVHIQVESVSSTQADGTPKGCGVGGGLPQAEYGEGRDHNPERP